MSDWMWGATIAGGLIGPGWQPIGTAPIDGTVVLVWASPREGLPGFQCTAGYHEDAGWCVDELREATHWMPLPPPPIGPA